MLEVAIVGGGLCGLALANTLQHANRSFALFEARDRLGGRILTRKDAAGTPVDLGPTWFWPDTQPRIARLIADLGLETRAQQEDGTHLMQVEPGGKPSPLSQPDFHGGARRVAGGMDGLVQALAARLPAAGVHLTHALTALRDRGTHVELHFSEPNGERFVLARRVVLALPPRLVEEHVRFDPPLAPRVREAMRDAPTWMAAQAKLVTRYTRAFWREQGLSGTAFTRYPGAVLAETWDASEAGEAGVLGAFLALPAALRDSFGAGLPMLTASHLAQLFGPAAQGGDSLYQDWAQEPHTCSTLDQTPPLLHPDYANRDLRLSHWRDKLYFGGTETAAYGAGYMEGALEAAGRIQRDLALDWAEAA